MRAFDRDLIRGGHYGQRSCEPHAKAEHMAAPTNAAFVKKALANSEPSTHGPFRTCGPLHEMSASGGRADAVSYEYTRSLSPSTKDARRCSPVSMQRRFRERSAPVTSCPAVIHGRISV